MPDKIKTKMIISRTRTQLKKVNEIIRLREDGKSVKEIANIFKLSPRQIYTIIKKKDHYESILQEV